MSFTHQLTIGHLDPAAITERREIVILRPLDMVAIQSTINELPSDLIEIHLEHDYLVVPWLGWDIVVTEAERLAETLARECGCVLADVANGEIVDPNDLSINLRPT